MSETEQEREDRESGKNDLALEGGICGLEAGCCLLNALTVFALFLSGSVLLLNR